MKNEGQLDTDVLIVGRGGGSIEDLWSFNEEPVIEAIFKSEIPVIIRLHNEKGVAFKDITLLTASRTRNDFDFSCL